MGGVVPRVLAVPHPQHVEDVGLAVAEPLLLLRRPRHQVVSGPQHQVGLQVAHYLLPKNGHKYVVSEDEMEGRKQNHGNIAMFGTFY